MTSKRNHRKKKQPPTPLEIKLAQLENQQQKTRTTNRELRRQLSAARAELATANERLAKLQNYHDKARPYVEALEENRADKTNPVEYYTAVSILEQKKKVSRDWWNQKPSYTSPRQIVKFSRPL